MLNRLDLRFSDRSIKVKLMILFTATATIALVVACTAFWIYSTVAFLGTLQHESETIAQMLSESTAAAITFNDSSAARETLSVLRAEPRVKYACVFDKSDNLLATYSQSSSPEDCPVFSGTERFDFGKANLLVHSPVTLKAERVGDLYIRISLEEMYTRLERLGTIGLIVLCLASLVAVALSSRWQHLISDPIIHLTRIANQVSEDSNYSLRASKTSNDETGMLIDQFNAMMEQINGRDIALQDAQDKLELRVGERTRDLQDEIAERKIIEQDLLNAKATAEASNQAKSAFLANMSHELRTPLNAIIGYSEMLEEDALSEENEQAASDLRRIQSAGRHLLSLVSDILDLSKIEAGKVEISMEIVQVSEIIERVAQTIEPLARRSGNLFTVEQSNVTDTIYADPTKLHQSLLNLLSNACKFTQNGIVSLTVRAHQDEDRQWICWEVKDSGIGIAPEGLKKLFQAFSQVDSSATRRHGGTGLGLAISQRLCRLMGGYITVESMPGEGSTFTIFMPAGIPDESACMAEFEHAINVPFKTRTR